MPHSWVGRWTRDVAFRRVNPLPSGGRCRAARHAQTEERLRRQYADLRRAVRVFVADGPGAQTLATESSVCFLGPLGNSGWKTWF